MNEDVRQNAFFCGLSGVLMLGYAWVSTFAPFADIDAAIYIMSFDVFRLTLYAGGTSFLVVAGLCATGIGVAALLDSGVSSLSGVLMLACAVCWIGFEWRADDMFFNLLVLVFGLLLAQSGIRGLASYRATTSRRSAGGSAGRPASRSLFGARDPVPPKPAAPKPAAPEPVHPASLASSVLPNTHEAPPEEGYLAALSKEQDETPPERGA